MVLPEVSGELGCQNCCSDAKWDEYKIIEAAIRNNNRNNNGLIIINITNNKNNNKNNNKTNDNNKAFIELYYKTSIDFDAKY